MENNLIKNTNGFLKGIKLATDSIRPTYGPNGTNAVIECDEYPFNKIVNDAYTIIQAVKTNNREEKLGLNLFKELMDKQDNISGDGRKTTAIIADELITQGLKLDIPRVQLKKELDSLIPLVEAKIDEKKCLITENEVEYVATIAGESKEIGSLLGEIYKQIGKDGIIHLEGSNTPKTSYKITEGVRFNDTIYLSSAMVHDEQAVKEGTRETRAVYENAHFLVTKKRFSNLGEINPILKMCIDNGVKSLVIFTDDMDSDVARSLINVHKDKNIPLNILILKAPVLWKNYIFEDFAKCVGATIVEDATGITFKNFPLSALGTCGKIITDSKETILLGIKDISEHIKYLNEEGSNDSKLRLSWLVNKTCNLYLGANSESDLHYKMMKCKDAINASRLALQDGVVKGGGECLSEIALRIDEEIGEHDNESIKILSEALKAPIRQLYINNANKPQIVEDNVFDASLVLKNAVRSAIGIASTALTIGETIPFIEKTEEELRLLTVTKPAF